MSYPAELTFCIGDEDWDRESLSPEKVRTAHDMFDKTGMLLMENVLRRAYVEELYQAWLEQYPQWSQDTGEQPNSLTVGVRRHMVTVGLKPPFSHAQLYANPFLLPLLRSLLGPKCVLNNMTCVVSFPGAPAQNWHIDHPYLFETSEKSLEIPCYALTVVVPLVDITETNGPTAMYPYSHHQPDTTGRDVVLPMMALGSAYLMDYRTIHAGMPNHGTVPRPVLYIVYSRSWFRDAANFAYQNTIIVPPELLAEMPAELRPLFALLEPSCDTPLRGPAAILEQNERLLASRRNGEPLPPRSVAEAEARLAEVLGIIRGVPDPRLEKVANALRSYVGQAHQSMLSDKVPPEQHGPLLNTYLVRVMLADVTQTGPRHPGLYTAAADVQNARVH